MGFALYYVSLLHLKHETYLKFLFNSNCYDTFAYRLAYARRICIRDRKKGTPQERKIVNFADALYDPLLPKVAAIIYKQF